jgi:hypothetical protein
MIDMIENQAGIKFNKVNLPSAEDIKKANASGVLTSLEKVGDDAVSLFEMAAKKFIEKNNGNAVNALAKALSLISGGSTSHTSSQPVSQSQSSSYDNRGRGDSNRGGGSYGTSSSSYGGRGGRGGYEGGRGSYDNSRSTASGGNGGRGGYSSSSF